MCVCVFLLDFLCFCLFAFCMFVCLLFCVFVCLFVLFGVFVCLLFCVCLFYFIVLLLKFSHFNICMHTIYPYVYSANSATTSVTISQHTLAILVGVADLGGLDAPGTLAILR